MKRIVLALALLVPGCATTQPRIPHVPDSKAMTVLVVAASVVSIGVVAASGSRGPQ